TAGSQIGTTLVFDGASGHPAPVTVSAGLFTVSLDFGASVFNGTARWLEISVNATVLSPRQPLTIAPFAQWAAASPGSGLWQASGSNIGNANSGNVGIGTTTPANKLTVSGNADVTGYLGLGNSSPSAPLSFSNALGDLIDLNGTAGAPHYGIGMAYG